MRGSAVEGLLSIGHLPLDTRRFEGLIRVRLLPIGAHREGVPPSDPCTQPKVKGCTLTTIRAEKIDKLGR